MTTEKEYRQSSAIAFKHFSACQFITGDMYTTMIEMNVLVVLYHLNCTVEWLRVLVVLYSSIVCNGSTVLIVLYSCKSSGCTDGTVYCLYFTASLAAVVVLLDLQNQELQ